MEFAGFPVTALDFYDDLEFDNTRSFWEAHKAVYADDVKAPMLALCQELEAEFGDAKVFRPYRDVRFAKDKTPYKTHQGAYVACGPSTGWYVELSARGVMTCAGFYEASSGRLAALREGIDDDTSGPELESVLAALADQGWERGGDRLKTSPRGYPSDHPRIELLRHRSLTMCRRHGFEPVIHTAELADVVRDDWRAARPLLDWVTKHGAEGDG